MFFPAKSLFAVKVGNSPRVIVDKFLKRAIIPITKHHTLPRW